MWQNLRLYDPEGPCRPVFTGEASYPASTLAYTATALTITPGGPNPSGKEWVGQLMLFPVRPVDQTDERNIIGRNLFPGELFLLAQVFGDQVDYRFKLSQRSNTFVHSVFNACSNHRAFSCI